MQADLPILHDFPLASLNTFRIPARARHYLRVSGAAELDAVLEDDVLVISRTFDLRWWLEDEFILELPLMPLHERCQPAVPLGEASEAAAQPQDRPHPFAALAALKKPDGPRS